MNVYTGTYQSYLINISVNHGTFFVTVVTGGGHSLQVKIIRKVVLDIKRAVLI